MKNCIAITDIENTYKDKHEQGKVQTISYRTFQTVL